jgi:hypothetical protein
MFYTMNSIIAVSMAIVMGLGVSLTIQSVSAQPPIIIGGKDFCQDFPKICYGTLSWCDRHPEVCLTILDIPEKITKIPLPDCPRCPEKVILSLNPGEVFVVGKLNNNTIAVNVSPQDVLNMLNNINATSNATSSLAK